MAVAARRACLDSFTRGSVKKGLALASPSAFYWSVKSDFRAFCSTPDAESIIRIWIPSFARMTA
jgi:hypothetical protein